MADFATQERAHLRLTQENHPENIQTVPKAPRVGLASMITISALSGLVGMTFGSAALSSCFMAPGPGEVLSMIPLVTLGVILLTGWVGAFFWMGRDEADSKDPS